MTRTTRIRVPCHSESTGRAQTRRLRSTTTRAALRSSATSTSPSRRRAAGAYRGSARIQAMFSSPSHGGRRGWWAEVLAVGLFAGAVHLDGDSAADVPDGLDALA